MREIGRPRYVIRPQKVPSIPTMTRGGHTGRGAGSGRRRDARPITLVIADDHRAFGEALQIALGREEDLNVLEVVDDGREAVRSALEHRPDVILMDAQMPLLDGIEATRKLRQEGVASAVIVLAGDPDELSLARAVQAGARGYLGKTRAIEELADAVRRAHRGEPLHRPEEVTRALRQLRERAQVDSELYQRVQRLTPREVEVLQALADGKRSELVARELGMSRNTLRTHVQNILLKLRVHSKVEAIVAAIRFGKVRPPDVIRLPESEELSSAPLEGSETR
jgi:DNA-binding NarL/FixJ family response regulator